MSGCSVAVLEDIGPTSFRVGMSVYIDPAIWVRYGSTASLQVLYRLGDGRAVGTGLGW